MNQPSFGHYRRREAREARKQRAITRCKAAEEARRYIETMAYEHGLRLVVSFIDIGNDGRQIPRWTFTDSNRRRIMDYFPSSQKWWSKIDETHGEDADPHRALALAASAELRRREYAASQKQQPSLFDTADTSNDLPTQDE